MKVSVSVQEPDKAGVHSLTLDLEDPPNPIEGGDLQCEGLMEWLTAMRQQAIDAEWNEDPLTPTPANRPFAVS